MCRQTTITASETEFTVSDSKFIVIDVGGQVAFRKTWAAFFDDAKAIIFVCSLAGYDQFMVENEEKNRMRDALDTFKDICGNALLQHVSVILLLNKMDLAERKFAAYSKSDAVNVVRKTFPEFAADKQEKDGGKSN
jgi:guanine nucleotide-binding protein G(i) subunit alpha